MTRTAYLLTGYDGAATWVAAHWAATSPTLVFYEANPLMAALMASTGFVVTIALRVALGAGLVAWLDWAGSRTDNRWGRWPLAAVVAVLSAVAVWNTGVLVLALTT